MKAQLNFDLTDPDDRDEHLRCILSLNLCSVLWEIDQWLRGEVKYGENGKKGDILQEARDKLTSLMDENDINLDVIYK